MVMYRLDYWTGNRSYCKMFPSREAAERFLRERTSAYRWNIGEVKLYV